MRLTKKLYIYPEEGMLDCNTYVFKDTATLVIDPGPRSIKGRDTQGAGYAFDSGSFLGTPVYLGELQTDEKGRLLFLAPQLALNRSQVFLQRLPFVLRQVLAVQHLLD